MPKRILPSNEILREMYESGMSSRDIADTLGANLNTVVSAMSRAGISNRTPGETSKLQFADGRREPTRYWEGKTQPKEMVEKRIAPIRGENHYLWKGGAHRRYYRNVVAKEQCVRCHAKANLGIHHVDFDHYHDDPENLQVLCVSCHMSIHKKAYWDAIHDGRKPPTSNGPVGRTREVTNETVLDERSGDVIPD